MLEFLFENDQGTKLKHLFNCACGLRTIAAIPMAVGCVENYEPATDVDNRTNDILYIPIQYSITLKPFATRCLIKCIEFVVTRLLPGPIMYGVARV